LGAGERGLVGEEKLRGVMGQFATTLRSLLSLPSSPPPGTLSSPAGMIIVDGVDYTSKIMLSAPRSRTGVAEWELDGISRYLYLEKYDLVTSKIGALRDLIERNTGMEVQPHVAEIVGTTGLLLAEANELVDR